MKPSTGFRILQFTAPGFPAASIVPAQADTLAETKAGFRIEDQKLNQLWSKLEISQDERTLLKPPR